MVAASRMRYQGTNKLLLLRFCVWVVGQVTKDKVPTVSLDAGKPPSWKKPYYGVPSPQCKRNPGKGATFEEENGVFNTEQLVRLLDDTVISAVETRGSMERRQPQEFEPISSSALAAYHFSCPQGGPMSQVFLWGVAYLDRAPNVEMLNWHNILGFRGTVLDRTTGRWSSQWDAIWCIPHDKLECWYWAAGHTYGSLDEVARTLSIGLVTSTRQPYQRPTVYEFCDEIGRRFRADRGTSCIIHRIQAYRHNHP